MLREGIINLRRTVLRDGPKKNTRAFRHDKYCGGCRKLNIIVLLPPWAENYTR